MCSGAMREGDVADLVVNALVVAVYKHTHIQDIHTYTPICAQTRVNILTHAQDEGATGALDRSNATKHIVNALVVGA